MRALVTGGAGFIGSALVRRLVADGTAEVLTLDKLTYAGNLDSIREALDSPRHRFERVDLCDAAAVRRVMDDFAPDVVFHLAAESHVDRSIDGPAAFVQTNVVGTLNLLEAARAHWERLAPAERDAFRLVHVSTDEVYGSLGDSGAFTEQSPYRPSSPYSASKAGSDHLARAWWHTYRLPVIVTNCSNNFGPYQFPEKLIPLMIERARERRELPVYGTGANVRDWMFVEDHVSALRLAAARGRPGETYVVGGHGERANLDVVHAICDLVDERLADGGPSRRSLVRFVTDRPGHDHRYAVDPSKAQAELGWAPRASFEENLRRTVAWYLDNDEWVSRVQSGAYRGERLGLATAERSS